jgi:hypothetical protein
MSFSLVYLADRLARRILDFFNDCYQGLMGIFSRSKPITPSEINRDALYFDEPRLRMTVGGRIIVRIVTYVTYLVLAVTGVALLISEISPLDYLGVFILLVLLDRWIHRGEGDASIQKILKDGHPNVAQALRSQAFAAIGRAADRSSITKKPFFLEVTARLIELSEIEDDLKHMNVDPKEFSAKLEEVLSRPAPAEAGSREDYLPHAALLTKEAFVVAADKAHRFIDSRDLFAALRNVHDERLDQLFQTFEIAST